jgi:hypothetical protein
MLVKVVGSKMSSLEFYQWKKKMIELLHECVTLWGSIKEPMKGCTIGGALTPKKNLHSKIKLHASFHVIERIFQK